MKNKIILGGIAIVVVVGLCLAFYNMGKKSASKLKPPSTDDLDKLVGRTSGGNTDNIPEAEVIDPKI